MQNPAENSDVHAPVRAGSGRLRYLLTWLAAAWLPFGTVACGGGGGEAGSATPYVAAPAQQLSDSDRQIAEHAYAGTPRTPAGFWSESPPPGTWSYVATRHVKSGDLTPAPPAPPAAFELCSNDFAEALAWSEAAAARYPVYADLVDTRSDARFYEFDRAPRDASGSVRRDRVFRCDYLDRSGVDTSEPSGFGGTMTAPAKTAESVTALAEYLWQFTTFNNANYVVLSSTASLRDRSVSHETLMAQLVRATAPLRCDRIELLRWTHEVDTATGMIARSLVPVRTILVSRASGTVESCTD